MCAEAQKDFYMDDAQLWYNIYAEKTFLNRWQAHINQETRFTNNISQFQLGYADVGLTYKFNKHIKILADYVFTERRRNQPYFATIHQYYAAIQFKQDIGRWRFAYRAMYQFQFNNPYTSADGMTAYHYERNKFTIKYEINKRYTAYVADELYIPLNNIQARGIERNRSFIGLFYNVTKHQKFELYFLYQRQLLNGDWYNQHNYYPDYSLTRYFIYGIGYSFEY